MKIRIVTPSQDILEDEAEVVYATGPKGEFGILPGHAHYVSPLAVGRLYYEKPGERKAFALWGGFLEVFQETVYVMADEVEPADRIDLKKSEWRAGELEKELSEGTLSPEQFKKLLEERDRELARVSAAQ